MQPPARRPEQRTSSTPAGGGGEGQPGGACGPHGGGANQSVRVGPAPLHETRPTNRRSITDGTTSSDLTRSAMEHASCEASLLLSLPGLYNRVVLADALHRIDHPRGGSATNTCIFYRTLTPATASKTRPWALLASFTPNRRHFWIPNAISIKPRGTIMPRPCLE
jgi:hypothetical protein